LDLINKFNIVLSLQGVKYSQELCLRSNCSGDPRVVDALNKIIEADQQLKQKPEITGD